LVDPSFHSEVRSREVKAFPLTVDARGNVYTVTGTSTDDSFVRIDLQGKISRLVPHVGHVVGVLAGLKEGFGGRFFANAGADENPAPHGIVVFDPMTGTAGPFATNPRDYADGALAFDATRERLYAINEAVNDLIALDKAGHREVLVTALTKHCCGLAIALRASSIARSSRGGSYDSAQTPLYC
jgi:hypothetical protein